MIAEASHDRRQWLSVWLQDGRRWAHVATDVVAELAKSVRLLLLVYPADTPSEPRVYAIEVLAAFVRYRDLRIVGPAATARSPTATWIMQIPYTNGGPTYVSNLKYLLSHPSSGEDVLRLA